MARFFRRSHSHPKRRRGQARHSLGGNKYFRQIVAGWEMLEDRAMLSINLGFAQATIPVNSSSVDGYAVATDTAGDSYELSGDAVYKRDPTGKILWDAPYTASSFFGDKEGLAVDGLGNVYITGNFGNSAGNPAMFGTTVLESAGSQDIYLAKLNSRGVFQWAESFGSSGWDEGSSIAVDGSGNAYLTGYYKGTVNFDAHGNHVLVDTGTWQDSFLLKVDTDGNYLWAKNFGTGAAPSAGVSVAVDPLDNVYTTGYFSGTVDFDPAQPGTHKLTAFYNAAYILKLDGAGNFVWGEKLNGDTAYGAGQSEGDAITVDNLGDIYTTGQVGGPVNLNPTTGGTPDVITPNFVNEDAYVIKLGPTGNFVWARDLQGDSGVNPHGIAADAFGNVYTTGGFNGSVDFDPGPGYYPLSTAGGEHIYVSALDNQGNFIWATATGEALGDRGYSIAISGSDTVNVVGTFSNTVNFNPGNGSPANRTAFGVWDSFIWNITQASISGTVWADQNSDGNHDLTEPGVPGAVALLYQTSDTIEGNSDDQLVATAITDGSGHYGFVGLTAALTSGPNYYVQVRTPIGYNSFTAEQAATSNPDQDSDVSQANGRTAIVKLTSTEGDVEDAGLLGAAPSFGMALGLKTLGFTSGNAVTTDAQGNIYMAGSFEGVGTDFDQGPGRDLLSSTGTPNSFIAKYTATGALVWAKQAVSDFDNSSSSIAVDGMGNVFVYGLYSGTATFGTFSLGMPRGITSNSAYLWKLDSQGNTQWTINPVAGAVDVAGGLTLDPLGDPHITGGFSGTAAVGSTTLTDAGTSGDDVFVARFDTDGNPTWAESFGGSGNDFGNAIAVDPSGNVGVTGVVTGSVALTLGTGSGTLNGGGASTAFVIELDRSANLLFANTFSSTIDSDGRGLAIDSAGNLYGVGTFDGTATFGPAPSNSLTGTNATYVVKLNNDGSFGWVDGFTTSLGIQGMGIAVDPNQNVYTTGKFAGIGDFNPSPTVTNNLNATGSSTDIFISKLDANGNYVAAYRFGDVGEDQGNSIATDANGLIYATGEINQAGLGGATNFSTTGTFFVGASGEQDDFLLKLGNAPLPYTPNVAPTFTAGGAQVVDEDASPQVVTNWATNISAGPASEANQTLNFIITTDNPSLFAVPPAIDPSTGTLTYTLNPNVDGVADVTVKLHDNGGTAFGGIDTSSPATFTITANFVNDQPTFQRGPSQTVAEDSGQQSVFGWASFISPGTGANEQTQTLHFNVTSDNPALFSVQPTIDSSGNLFYTPAPNTSGVANVSVTLQDSGGTANGGVDTSPMFTFPITVLFVNDQPSFTPGLSQSANENAGTQTVVGWATNISPGEGANEAGQTLTFYPSNNNPALFTTGGQPTVDPITGNLTYTPNSDVSGVAFVTLVLGDNGGTANLGVATSVAHTFTIAVNFVNDAPSFAVGPSQTVNEDAGEQVQSNFATKISPDQHYPNAAQNEAGQTVHFTLTTNNNSLFSELPTIDPSGKLVYTPAANTSGQATVTVWLQDDGGTFNGGIDTSAPQTFTITVNFVNDSPSFLKGADQTIYVGAGPQTVPGWATSISAGAGANEGSQTVNFVVTNDSPGLFVTAPQVDAAGQLTYTPQPGAIGVAHVSVKLHDDGGTTVNGIPNVGVDTSPIQTFTITILALNTAPTFTPGGDQEVTEDATAQSVPWASNITPGTGPDDPGQTVHFNVSNDNSALFAVQPSIDANGRLTYTPAPMMDGTANVTVAAQDNGGTTAGGVDTSAAVTFQIKVDFVNDSPSFTPGANQEVLENPGAETVLNWATNLSPGSGANEAGQKLNFTVTNSDNSLFSVQPSVDPITGTLTYTPAANQDGTANVTVTLGDDGGTAHGGVDQFTQTFQIKVDLVNSAPSFVKGPDQTVDEDAGAQNVLNWATAISPGLDPSEANQSLNFVVLSDSNAALFTQEPTIDPTTGTLTYALAPNVNGSATLAIALHDNGGMANGGVDTSPRQVFTVNAVYVNDAPTFNAIGNQTVNENAGLQRVANWATNLSPGPGANETWQTVQFNLTDSNPGLFLIPPSVDANGTLTYAPAPNVSGVAHLIATLKDNGGTANGGVDASTAFPFDINVNFVNSAPSFAHGLDQTVGENSGAQVVPNWATQISPGQSAQEQGQSLNFTVTPIDAASAALFATTPTIDSSGTLTFRPALNASGTATLNVTLHDDGGTANGGVDTSPIETFHITINPVPALLAPITDQTVNENAADAVFNLAGIFDPSDPVTLSVTDDHPDIVAAMLETSQLMLHFLADQFGVAHIDLKATDSQGKTIDDKFTVTVNLVNHAPSFVKGGDITAGDKAGQVTILGWAGKIAAGPASESGQSLAFNVVGNTNPTLFAAQPAIDPATGNLTFTPQPGQFGSANISLALTDSGGTANGGQDTSAVQTFKITISATVKAMPDQYVLSVGPASTVSASQGVLTNDGSDDGSPLTAQLVQGPTHGTVTLNPDGSFSYAKGPSFRGVDQFSYQARDGQAVSNVVTVSIISYESTIVEKLYQQVLDRPADSAGLQYWTNQVQNGQPYGNIAQGIFESPERLDPIITNYYQQYLGRTADAAGLKYWVNVWQQNGGPDDVVAGMISSPEFYHQSGGTNSGWLTQVYERLLNRPEDAQGMAYWNSVLGQNSNNLGSVALSFEHSNENFQNVVTGFYEQYLQRKPTSTELAAAVQTLASGGSQRDIEIGIINSNEYRNSPAPPASQTGTRVG